ncbi:cellulase family glycosylhydrolase [Paenibacillus sp. GCM10012307]|uniref:Cellulase family glycosylhydrolase n=1 Tax=Paenibacillus roseus TaxID=2798579 RepID=A0A934J8J5_9BACL|nr:glycoside hydrolase family 5 protein [Paenibacillus roseus]MBJ6362661.1 cellulase family glycosylhydrolase [Paenibacillus roseus]
MFKKSLLVTFSALLLSSILGFIGPAKVEAAFSQNDFLKANGTVIRNNFGNGDIVNLRGTNLGGWLLQENWMTPAGAVDEYTLRRTLVSRFGEAGAQNLLNSYQDIWIQASDLDNIKNMGMNAVRVPIYWEDFMDLSGNMKPDSVSFRKLDWLIEQSGNRNIYVILDMHGTPGAHCPWHSCGRENSNQLWTNSTYQNWTIQIWERIATRYNGNPTVAAYDLLNEPLVTNGAGENAAQVRQKMDFYDRLYKAVRAKDPDHIIMIAAFFEWFAALPPSTYGWTNVVYQTHHYNFADWFNWNLTNSEIERWLRNITTYQRNWNVPVYAGEFSFDHNDLYEKWLSGLNALNVSWTNWTYKVKGGGNWGYYNNNNNPSPNLNTDSASTIISKWNQFVTSNFNTNTSLINLVKKYTQQAPTPATWTALKANANQRYVSADNYGNNPLIADRTQASGWEMFKMINNPDGTVSFLSMANNRYVQANPNQGGRLIANGNTIQQWEKFQLENVGNGLVALKALANNQYVCVDLSQSTPVLYANRPSYGGQWEQFTLEQLQ